MTTYIVTNVEAQDDSGHTAAVIGDLDGIVHPDDVTDPLDTLDLPAHEDEQQWADLAAQAAGEAGWRIVGDWQRHPTLAGLVAAAVERGALYAAHIATAADQLGDPEVVVMTAPDPLTLSADPIVSYPLPDDADWREVLSDRGWRVVGEPTHDPYTIVDVEPVDWPELVRSVTSARAQARFELDRQDTAWRSVIRDAMRADGTPRRPIWEAAEITEARAYQIRDGRR
jgi:hypothetical protein